MLVDLDHFLIARLKTGRWSAVRFCFTNPAATVADQRRIFDAGDVGLLSRLASHLLILGVVVPMIALSSVSLAILTGVVLYVHILCDVLWDRWRLERRAAEIASTDELIRALR
ncbi:hypothetical protein [Natronorubrum tibetense]|uniref:Uncharacterized protein n=1 Tax=Natronorubrum tibetense GA33 TaxID=1114856 RepID=L9W197_9EURY|nr:hypothetical protein C496_06942 [Natronorubrum tibetense GA33]